MSVTFKIALNKRQIQEKVTNTKFGKFVATEWKRLIDGYTPRDTGQLESNVTIRPFEIHYKSKYARRQYYGRDFKFQKKNPHSTYEWDKAAEQAGQKNKLCRTVNAALKNGRF